MKLALALGYTEVESGENNQRAQLASAIDRAKKEGAVLVIAKLDHIGGPALKPQCLLYLHAEGFGVNFQCVDMPDVNTLTIGIFATLAQHERELISSRTKAALTAKIAQGAILGKPENLTPEAQAKGAASTRRNTMANPDNRRATSMIDMMRKAGKNYSQIAEQLNRDGFRTSRGCEFQATQVMRLAKRQA